MNFGAISSECSMTFGPAECTTLPATGVCMRLNPVVRQRPLCGYWAACGLVTVAGEVVVLVQEG